MKTYNVLSDSTSHIHTHTCVSTHSQLTHTHFLVSHTVSDVMGIDSVQRKCVRDSSVFDSCHSARLDISLHLMCVCVWETHMYARSLSPLSRNCVRQTVPLCWFERGKGVKKKEWRGKRCKERRGEESAGKGGECWDEGYSRQRQMHLKPKSAKATVGKREANREGNTLPGKMNQTLANLQKRETERWIDGGITEWGKALEGKETRGEWFEERQTTGMRNPVHCKRRLWGNGSWQQWI